MALAALFAGGASIAPAAAMADESEETQVVTEVDWLNRTTREERTRVRVAVDEAAVVTITTTLVEYDRHGRATRTCQLVTKSEEVAGPTEVTLKATVGNDEKARARKTFVDGWKRVKMVLAVQAAAMSGAQATKTLKRRFRGW